MLSLEEKVAELEERVRLLERMLWKVVGGFAAIAPDDELWEFWHQKQEEICSGEKTRKRQS